MERIHRPPDFGGRPSTSATSAPKPVTSLTPRTSIFCARARSVRSGSPAVPAIRIRGTGTDWRLVDLPRVDNPGGPPCGERFDLQRELHLGQGAHGRQSAGLLFRLQQNQYARYLERADDPNIRPSATSLQLHLCAAGGEREILSFSSMPAAANAIIGGWQLAGITTMLTGARLSPAYSWDGPGQHESVRRASGPIGDGNFDSSDMRDSLRRDSRSSTISLCHSGRRPRVLRNFRPLHPDWTGQVLWNMGIHKNWMLQEACSPAIPMGDVQRLQPAEFLEPETRISRRQFRPGDLGRSRPKHAIRTQIGLLRRCESAIRSALPRWWPCSPVQDGRNITRPPNDIKCSRITWCARAAEVTRNNLAEYSRILQEWKRQRPEVLKRFLYMLGLDPMPPKTPLNARITGAFERDGYRVENIVFESMPRLYVTGNLYLPKNVTGRAPGQSSM